MVVPGPAASIINPMIEVPPTVSAAARHVDVGVEPLDRLHEFRRGARVQSLFVADFEHAHDGAVAAQLAHFPASTRLAMVTYLRPASCAAVTASGSGLIAAHLGELDQHRQVDAGDHFDLGPAHAGDREIGGRAAEHVGQDRDAIAGIDALHRFDDVLAALLDIVVGTDGDRFDLLLRTDDMLQRRAKFHGEPAVGNENKADHQELRRAQFATQAPHERALILTIRKPIARPARAISASCCIAGGRKAIGILRGAITLCSSAIQAAGRLGRGVTVPQKPSSAGRRPVRVRPEAARGECPRSPGTWIRVPAASRHRRRRDRRPDGRLRPARTAGCRMPRPRISISPCERRTGRTSSRPWTASSWMRSSPTSRANACALQQCDSASRDLPEPDGPRIRMPRVPHRSRRMAWMVA